MFRDFNHFLKVSNLVSPEKIKITSQSQNKNGIDACIFIPDKNKMQDIFAQMNTLDLKISILYKISFSPKSFR
jgi:hypothetical protein